MKTQIIKYQGHQTGSAYRWQYLVTPTVNRAGVVTLKGKVSLERLTAEQREREEMLLPKETGKRVDLYA